MYKLISFIKKLLNLDSDIIICPCGYKTTSHKKAIRHIARHPGGIDNIDYNTGAVIW
jgi:hypothetical protein